jgi:hypothetical protein
LKPEDAVCFFQARQTICASHLARKSCQFAGASEMQKRFDQIDTGKFNTDISDEPRVISIPTSAVPLTEPHIGTYLSSARYCSTRHSGPVHSIDAEYQGCQKLSAWRQSD